MTHVKVHRSTAWYIASATCFVLVAAAACLAGDRYNSDEQIRGVEQPIFEIASTFVEGANPAPSVKLKVTSAPWCVPCRRIKPVLEKLKAEGYTIEVETLDSPGKSVPYFEWFQFERLDREGAGIDGYPNLSKVERTLRHTFREIENPIFTETETTGERPWLRRLLPVFRSVTSR